MKTKFFSLALLSLFFLSAVYAQESSVGIKGGLNLSSLSTDDNNDDNLKLGLHVGVFNKIALSENFAIQPELMYSGQGIKIDYDEGGVIEGETKFKLHYVNVPVKLVFNLSEDFEFQLGPYVGYLVKAKLTNDGSLAGIDIDTEDEIDRDHFNTWDFGLTAGFGFDLDPIIIGLNYNVGFNQVAKEDEPAEIMLEDAKNRVIQISVGLRF